MEVAQNIIDKPTNLERDLVSIPCFCQLSLVTLTTMAFIWLSAELLVTAHSHLKTYSFSCKPMTNKTLARQAIVQTVERITEGIEVN